MTDQPLHSEVREATAPYGTSLLARLREVLERDAAEFPIQPCRVVETVEDGIPVVQLQLWDKVLDDNHERWVARQQNKPHPPRNMRWRVLRRYREDQLSEESLAAADKDREESAAYIRQTMTNGLWEVPDPAPPGYEDDYDQEDWFYDLRHGFVQHRRF